MHVSKDSMWRGIWKILQNFLGTKRALVLAWGLTLRREWNWDSPSIRRAVQGATRQRPDRKRTLHCIGVLMEYIFCLRGLMDYISDDRTRHRPWLQYYYYPAHPVSFHKKRFSTQTQPHVQYYVNSSYRRSAWLGKVQPLGGPDAVMDYVYAVAYTAYIS
jgi:hypothetical protein